MYNDYEQNFRLVDFKVTIEQSQQTVTIATPMSEFCNSLLLKCLELALGRIFNDRDRASLVTYDSEDLDWLYRRGAIALHRSAVEVENNISNFLTTCWVVVEEKYDLDAIQYFEILDSWSSRKHPSALRFSLELGILASCIFSSVARIGSDSASICSIIANIFSSLESEYCNGQTGPASLDPAFYSGNYAPFSGDEVRTILADGQLHDFMVQVLGSSGKLSYLSDDWRMLNVEL